ncbi:MAG: hypothetical protein KJ732_07530 [Candidatus Margulisbacteria bacterium]|nr:hypothetical protein [Candidatus Margulisiibacteriota bacterium]
MVLGISGSPIPVISILVGRGQGAGQAQEPDNNEPNQQIEEEGRDNSGQQAVPGVSVPGATSLASISNATNPQLLEMLRGHLDRLSDVLDRLWASFGTPKEEAEEDALLAEEREEIEAKLEEIEGNIYQLNNLLSKLPFMDPIQAAQRLAQAESLFQQISNSVTNIQTGHIPPELQNDLTEILDQYRNLEQTMLA